MPLETENINDLFYLFLYFKWSKPENSQMNLNQSANYKRIRLASSSINQDVEYSLYNKRILYLILTVSGKVNKAFDVKFTCLVLFNT